MKITESHLRKIIREEIALTEAPPPPPPKPDSSKVLPIPPKALPIIREFMSAILKQAQKYAAAAKDPESKESKELLALAHNGDWHKMPADSYEMYDNFKKHFGHSYDDTSGKGARDKVLAALNTALCVNKETGKYNGKAEDKGSVSYEVYIQDNKPSLERIAQIFNGTPAYIRMEFKKAGIAQP